MIRTVVNTGCADILLLGRLHEMDRCEYRCADILLLGKLYDKDRCEYRMC